MADLLEYYRKTAPMGVSQFAEHYGNRRRDGLVLLAYQIQSLTQLVDILIKQNNLLTGGGRIGEPGKPRAGH